MPVIEQFRQTGYKQETVELTPETLAAAQYGTVWYDALIEESTEYNERRPDRATHAPLQGQSGAFIGKFTGKFSPRPSGTDNTAPDWYALLAASGAIVATDVATWGAALTSSAAQGKSVTIKSRDGEYERVLAGARFAKLRFFAEKGGLWLCESEAMGRFSRTTQTAFLAAANPTAGLASSFLGLAIAIGAYSGSVASAEIAIENTVSSVKDGTHASGYAPNLITEQKLMFRAQLLSNGSVDWRDKFRGDAAGDLLAVSLQMSAGTAGNVLTWTGNLSLSSDPKTTFLDGIGYTEIEGEFVSDSDSAALTLTQS